MKFLATAAVGAALAATSVVTPAQAFPQNLVIGGAVGLASGLLLGGAIANAHQPRAQVYGYQPSGEVYGSVASPEWSAGPNCTASTRYDYAGRPFVWKDCR